MRLTINGYDVPQYQALCVRFTLAPLPAEANRGNVSRTKTLEFEAFIEAANQGDLDTQIGLLETAVWGCNKPGASPVGFTLNDGSTPSKHWLSASGSESGIECLAFEWGEAIGNEYNIRRTFRGIFSASYLEPGLNNLVQYSSFLEKNGTGGPLFIYRPVISGPPRKIITQSASTYIVVQGGFAVGYESLPAVDAPLFAHEHVDRRRIWNDSGQLIRGTQRNFRREWTYVFEHTSALF